MMVLPTNKIWIQTRKKQSLKMMMTAILKTLSKTSRTNPLIFKRNFPLQLKIKTRNPQRSFRIKVMKILMTAMTMKNLIFKICLKKPPQREHLKKTNKTKLQTHQERTIINLRRNTNTKEKEARTKKSHHRQDLASSKSRKDQIVALPRQNRSETSRDSRTKTGIPRRKRRINTKTRENSSDTNSVNQTTSLSAINFLWREANLEYLLLILFARYNCSFIQNCLFHFKFCYLIRITLGFDYWSLNYYLIYYFSKLFKLLIVNVLEHLNIII